MQKQLIAIVLFSSLTAWGTAQAQGMTRDQYSAAKDKIEADYKVAKAQCDALKDNAKDVCQKQAEAAERNAKAELEHQYKPSPKHHREVDEAKAKGAYEVAKEKCDDANGDAKKACEAQAKADYEQAKATIKANKY